MKDCNHNARSRRALLVACIACSVPILLSCASTGEEEKVPRCGDGVIDFGEACDDGNTEPGDGCRADCRGMEVCGDGLLDELCEACDDGRETANCDADCTEPECGDGTFNPSAGEVCSGSDDVDCFIDCPCVDCCGNGRLDPGEECDEGGSTGYCDGDCTLAVCGDGYENAAAGERCDWGAKSNVCGAMVRDGTRGNRDDVPDSCRTDCQIPYCGDGMLDRGEFPGVLAEECDEGGQDTGTCNADCTAAVCGDGYVNGAAGEACDGHGVDTAGCNFDCTAVLCGDGYVNEAAGESCETHGDCPASYCQSREPEACTCLL